MKKLVLMAAALPLLAGAAPSEDETRGDVRCLVALMQLTQMEDPAVKEAGLMGALYYMGRLDGRMPALDLEAAMEREIRALTDAEYASLFQSCGATMQERGARMVQIGESLTKKGP